MISYPELVTRGDDWNKSSLYQHSKTHRWCTSLPANLTHLTITPFLGTAPQSQLAGSNSKWQDHRTGGADPRPSHLTLGREPSRCVLEVTVQWNKKTTSLGKSRDVILRPPNQYEPFKLLDSQLPCFKNGTTGRELLSLISMWRWNRGLNLKIHRASGWISDTRRTWSTTKSNYKRITKQIL